MEPSHIPPHQYQPPPVDSFLPTERYQFPPPIYPPHLPAYPPPARGYHHYHRPRPYNSRGGRGQRRGGQWKRRRGWSDGSGQSHSNESLYSQSMFEDPWNQLTTEEEKQTHQEHLAAHIRERLPSQKEKVPTPMVVTTATTDDTAATPPPPANDVDTMPDDSVETHLPT